jgi:hypothetical protein
MVDGRGRPLVLVVTAWQANDSPMLPALLEGLRVPRVACQGDGTMVLPRAWDHLEVVVSMVGLGVGVN